MRRLLFAVLSFALIAQQATAGQALPSVPRDTLYPKARALMIKAGFQPQRILKRPGHVIANCGGQPDPCKVFPEIMACSTDGYCNFLFLRRGDGRAAIVSTSGDDGVRWCYCVTKPRWADDLDRKSLQQFVIARPDAGAEPQIRKFTPYETARRQMIAQGFEPRPIRANPDPPSCGDDRETPCFPEVMSCGVPDWECDWLFARRSDGAFFVVVTHNEGEGWREAAGRPRVMFVRRAWPEELEYYSIAMPVRKDRSRVR